MHFEKSIIVQILHSIPHINVSLNFVNSTFNPNSSAYIEVRKRQTRLSRIKKERKKFMYIFVKKEIYWTQAVCVVQTGNEHLRDYQVLLIKRVYLYIYMYCKEEREWKLNNIDKSICKLDYDCNLSFLFKNIQHAYMIHF